MKFTVSAILFTVLAMFSVVWSTLGRPVLNVRDVFDPPITYPRAGDNFTAGQSIMVTWDTSSLPAGTPNKGMIVLGHLTSDSENLDVGHPLATGFLLTDGHHRITFPHDLRTRDNYILDLFGDSGNISPKFTIHAKY